MLLDTHYHFDFLPAPARASCLAQLADAGVRIVAQTLTPSGFRELLAEVSGLGDAPLPLWSVGYHPWYVDAAEVEHELHLFADAVTQTRFIGEIGLDFSPRRLELVSESLQLRVLRELLELVRQAAGSAAEPYVLSLHAVRSASAVLDLLDELAVGEHNIVPVIHWFSGTSDELTRLIRLGGLISIHPQMLAGKRGRAYARQVPADRLLLESDLPSAPLTDAADAATELVGALTQTFETLTRLRPDLDAQLPQTQHRLYGIDERRPAKTPPQLG